MTRGHAFSFLTDAAGSGMRLDLFLSERLSGCSRSFAGQLISGQQVNVNGQVRKPAYRVKAGDIVSGHLPGPQPCRFQPEPMALHILYEDPHLLAINKPPGLVVHPAPGHSSGTLVNGLLYHCPDLGVIGTETRPGIVHRLDKDTSGALVVAKTAAALEHLAAQFKNRSVRKDYFALVHGEMAAASGTIRLPVGRHPVDRKRMSTRSRTARDAETGWRVARRWDCLTLLEIQLKTGRTHQIRVHCAAIAHPIVGDPVYGRRRAAKDPPHITALLVQARRQMLHAWRLEINHPVTGERMRFEAPLPEDMQRLIAALEGGDQKAEGESRKGKAENRIA